MKAFLEVASCGSFLLAAKKLCVTQSTVSARIKALEERLQASLFIRNRNGSVLSPGGERFYRYALTAVRAWDRAQQEVSLPELFKTRLCLGVQLNHWDSIATPWIDWMHLHQPNMATKVISDFSPALIEQLCDSVIDLAIVYQPKQVRQLVVEFFNNERLIPVSTVKTDTIDFENHVFVDWGEGFKIQYANTFPEAPAPRLSVGLGEVGLRHILEHGGSIYMLEKTVGPLLASGQLHSIDTAAVFLQQTYLVYQQATDRKLIQVAIEGLNSLKMAI